jgi:hypothetical protein
MGKSALDSARVLHYSKTGARPARRPAPRDKRGCVNGREAPQ